MRSLTKKQKQVLDKWYDENKDKIQIGIAHFDMDKCDLFSIELFEELEGIHDTEILAQEINRYIQEKAGY